MQYHVADEVGVPLSAASRIGLAILSLISLLVAIVIASSTLGMFWVSFQDWTWLWSAPMAALPILFIALGVAAAWDAFDGMGRRWSVFGVLLLVDVVLAICVPLAHFIG